MSGYGSPDDEAIHAGILAENGIRRVQALMYVGESSEYCIECGDRIPEARRLAVPGVKKCVPCTEGRNPW